MIRSLLKLLLLASLILLGVAYWMSTAFPPEPTLIDALQNEPQQRAIHKQAFEADAGGIAYTVQPLYTYELTGLVVSKHDAGGWRDYIHREWNDALNIMDVCVVWGNNIRTQAYRQMDFWNGQFTCNYSTSSNEVYAAFDRNSLSNNHLLTENPSLARLIRNAQVGDQIHFRGYLAEYAHHQGFDFKRGTSTVRTDTGNGACETVYVEDFEILRPGGGPWRTLYWVGWGMLALSLLGWFMQPVRFDD